MTLAMFLGLYNYWIVIFLMMTGFYIVIARENLIKTVIGLNIFQTSVFLLYITMGKVKGGTAPIIQGGGGGHESHGHGHESRGDHGEKTEHGSVLAEQVIEQVGFDEEVTQTAQHANEHVEHATAHVGDAAQVVAEYNGVLYSNPLPSVLMLTAIVVGIATTALALALIVRIREEYGTIEEDEILELDRNS